MTRKQALVEARVAGYHNDTRRGAQVLIEGKISRSDYDTAFIAGQNQRKSGLKCGCYLCITGNGDKK